MSSPRARYREMARDEIKETAARRLDDLGVDGLALRAIARDVGLSPAAIYGYFSDRDALLTELIADSFGLLTRHLATVSGLAAMARAWQEFAAERPARYRLIFGDPVPGYSAPDSGATVTAARGLGRVVLTAVIDEWPATPPETLTGSWTWRRFNPDLAMWVRTEFAGAHPAQVAFHLRFIARCHGAAELRAQAANLLRDPDELGRLEIAALLAELA